MHKLLFACAYVACSSGWRLPKKLNRHDSLESLFFALYPASASIPSRFGEGPLDFRRRFFARQTPWMIEGEDASGKAEESPASDPLVTTAGNEADSVEVNKDSIEPLPEVSASDIFRRIAYKRRTARDYDETKDIPNDVLADILATAQRAPTGFNVQPYKIVVVRDESKRKQLSNAFVGDGNVRRVRKAPVTVIFLADLEPARLIPKTMELGRKEGLPEQFLTGTLAPGVLGLTVPGRFGIPSPLNLATTAASLFTPLPVLSDVEAWSFKNTALVASQMMLAAASHGVSSSPMEGFDARRILQVLKMPLTELPRYSIPLAISMGYDVDPPKDSPSLRFPPEDIFFLDEFGKSYEGIKSM